jgi:hypothetical protein
MKKFFLAILAVGAVATAQAQKAGSILVYGSAGYSAAKETDDDGLPGTADVVTKDRNWHFAPGIGYQFNKNWTVGINFGIGMSTMTNDNGSITTEDKMRELMVGPFVRYTTPISKTFFIFNQVNLSYLNGKMTDDDGVPGTPDIESSYNGFAANWFPAVGVNFTKCMAFTLDFGGLGYAKRTWDLTGPQEVSESAFDFNFGRTFNIGIQANLGGKRHRGHSEPGMDHRHMDTSDDSEEDMPKKKRSSDIEE